MMSIVKDQFHLPGWNWAVVFALTSAGLPPQTTKNPTAQRATTTTATVILKIISLSV